MTLVPAMLEEILVYRETLREHAGKGDTFHLDTVTLRFMMDMMGSVIL